MAVVVGADWLKGRTLEELRPYAELGRERNSGYVYGAFGLAKERDIALWMDDSTIREIRTQPDGERLLAFWRCHKGGVQHSFTGSMIRLDGVLASDVACVRGAETMVVERLRKEADWIEIFEEDLELRRAVETGGYSYAFSKVSAGSDIHGMYVRAERGGGLFGNHWALSLADEVALAELQAGFLGESELGAIREELSRFELGREWTNHYSSYNVRKSWTAISLRGYNGWDSIEKPAEMSQKWKREHPELLARKCVDTELAREFPGTVKVVRRLPGPYQRVRFMRLAAGNGELSRHADITDREAGTRVGGIARLHVPITTGEGCMFSVWNARGMRGDMHLREGGLYYLDTRRPHAVVNKAGVVRVHLVVDCIVGAETQRLIGLARDAIRG
jgi:hypothetical protein